MQYVLNPQVPYEKYFEEMTRIPHGSENEKQYSDYLVAFAAQRGLRCIQDALWNVVIYKPASPGYEAHPPVILQAHIDMVCEKDLDCVHNFETDPLKLVLDGKWVGAKGTTLGADDGVGVAYILSILDSDIPHPPLECLFTVQEECGLVGAAALKSEYFQARRLIGLDNVEGTSSYISCADGQRYRLRFCGRKEKSSALPFYRLVVSGARGGHSGADIIRERANPIQLAARAMEEIGRLPGRVLVASVSGGNKDNAIPRDCTVQFAASAEQESILQAVQRVEDDVKMEYRFSEDALAITLDSAGAEPVYTEADSRRLLDLLFVLPTGMEHHSVKIDGLATASENLGVIRTEGETTDIQYFIRSELASSTENIVRLLETLAKTFGCTTERGNYSPGWAYMENSPLRQVLQKTYTAITGREMEMIAVHGGLECGFFASLVPGMDIVTIGPLVEDYHTPRERLDRESFAQIYRVLTAMLEQL